MKSLYEYIIESTSGGAYNIAWTKNTEFKNDGGYNTPKDAEAYVTHIKDIFSWASENEMFMKVLNLVARMWDESYGFTKEMIPFRWSKTTEAKSNNKVNIKLARAYWGLLEGRLPKDIKIVPGRGKDHKIVCGTVTIEEGNGMGGGLAGYKFEDVMVDALIRYFVANLTLDGLDEKGKTKLEPDAWEALKKIHTNEDLRNQLQACLKKYQEKMTKNEDYIKFLQKQIYKTGESRNKRGISNVVPQKDVEGIQRDPDDNINQEIREKSGSIISDINISNDTSDPIHLSIKRAKAQLSGIAVQNEETGKYMSNVLKVAEADNSPAYEDIKDRVSENDLKRFNEFWTNIGVDPKSVYSGWQLREPKVQQQLVVLNEGAELEKRVGEMIHNILGGNYWYVSPEKCVWVPADSLGITYKPTRAYITSGADGKKGTGIVITGKISGALDAQLTVRSTGSGYPYRMFTIVDVQDLLTQVGKKES